MERGEMNRRSLIYGGLSLIAAPAIVRAASLMPVNSRLCEGWVWHSPYYDINRDLVVILDTLEGLYRTLSMEQAVEMGLAQIG